MFKAALFDLDGVVFDTEPQYTVFWRKQCKEFHPEIPNLEQTIKGQTLTQIYDGYFSGDLKDKQQLITDRLNEFETNMTFDYVAGFMDFIRDLRSKRIKTAVVTSSNKPKMKNIYAKCPEFKDLFDVILTSEDFAHSKPDPDCYIKASKATETQTNDCIVFEDSFNGLKSGRAAGMRVVGLATTNTPRSIAPYSDCVITDYNDTVLKTFLDNI